MLARSGASAADANDVSSALAGIGKAQTASTWKVRLEAIRDNGPGLLVLLSHTGIERDIKETALIIAQADKCYSTTFGRPYVRGALFPDNTADSRPGPVVFLLGCDTTRAAC